MTAKDFKMLGKLVYSQHPAASRQLITAMKHIQQDRTDYQNISIYFQRFCQFKNIDPKVIYSIKSLRVFFSAMIHMYVPHLLLFKKCGYIPVGFIKALHEVTGKNKGNLSKDINIILLREKVYEEYRDEVQELLTFLKEDQDEKESQLQG